MPPTLPIYYVLNGAKRTPIVFRYLCRRLALIMSFTYFQYKRLGENSTWIGLSRKTAPAGATLLSHVVEPLLSYHEIRSVQGGKMMRYSAV